jgi:hypothetical protein
MPGRKSCAINERSMRRCVHTWSLGLAFAFCWLAHASMVRAEAKGTVLFEWIAPEGCPPESSVNAEIDNLLGGVARDRAREDLTVEATVEHGALWSVTLETMSSATSGHRTIEAATCQGLANATALIVALMIDPDAVAARAGKVKERETALPPAAPSAPAPPSPPVQRATFGLAGVGATGNLGVLPAPDVGIGAEIGLVRRQWRVELRAAYGLRNVRSDTLSDPAGAYGRFRFFAATLAGCWTIVRPAVDLGPCAEAEFGAVYGEGSGASQNTAETTPWFGLGAGGVVSIKASPWLHFPLHADAVVPLWRPNFTFRNVDSPIFRSRVVGGRLTVGVELRF